MLVRSPGPACMASILCPILPISEVEILCNKKLFFLRIRSALKPTLRFSSCHAQATRSTDTDVNQQQCQEKPPIVHCAGWGQGKRPGRLMRTFFEKGFDLFGFAGREPSFPVVASSSLCPTVCSMVLQERAWIQQVNRCSLGKEYPHHLLIRSLSSAIARNAKQKSSGM